MEIIEPFRMHPKRARIGAAGRLALKEAWSFFQDDFARIGNHLVRKSKGPFENVENTAG